LRVKGKRPILIPLGDC